MGNRIRESGGISGHDMSANERRPLEQSEGRIMRKNRNALDLVVGLFMIFGAMLMIMGFIQVYDSIMYLFDTGQCQ